VSSEAVTAILTILGSLLAGGGAAAIINAWNARRKAPSEIKVNDAGAEKIEAETAGLLIKAAAEALKLVKEELEGQIKNIRSENSSLRCEVTELKSENAELEKVQKRHEYEIGELQKIADKFDEVLGGAHTLYDQVIDMDGTPKYKPPERRKKT